MILSTHERASQARRAPAGSGVLQLRRLMPAAELESRLRCVRRRKMGAPKTENAVLCASSLHTSAGAMDPKRWRPSSRKISIAERVARGSAHGGAWCGSADGYFTRYFAPRGPIDESRPDRGYAATDRTRAFGTRVGRRVAELVARGSVQRAFYPSSGEATVMMAGPRILCSVLRCPDRRNPA